MLIKIFISKIKRLKRLKKETSSQKNLDILISDYKPPIFWKDKEVIRTQIMNWTSLSIKGLIIETNNIELLVKKNSINALNSVFDFLINKCSATSN